jgi:P4 family phage/plasmid primase-like protien
MTAPQPQQRLQDAHIMERIADDYLADYRYTAGLGWMHWNEHKWEEAPHPDVVNAVRVGLIEFQRNELLAGASDERARSIAGLLSAGRINGITNLAKGYLLVRDSDFDAHPDLLNVGNGVIDLRTGELGVHDPSLFLTRITGADYVAGATHPDWTTALKAVPEDARDWLQLHLGQAVTGYQTPDDVNVVARGTGENGKTSIFGPVKAATGDYTTVLGEKVLLAHPGDHPVELMALRGARLAIIEETPELGHLNVKRLKAISGTTHITARDLYKVNTTFRATHSLFITTNYSLRVDEVDHGTWRRLVMIPFPYTYLKPWQEITNLAVQRHGDMGLRHRLVEGEDGQHEAVLAWLVEGAGRWYAEGKKMGAPPKSVLDATREWRMAADLLLRYADEKLIFDPTPHVMTVDLYLDFNNWLLANRHQPWSDQTVSARIKDHSAFSVEKRQVSFDPSNPPSRLNGSSKIPPRYAAWLGVRFRPEPDRGWVGG